MKSQFCGLARVSTSICHHFQGTLASSECPPYAALPGGSRVSHHDLSLLFFQSLQVFCRSGYLCSKRILADVENGTKLFLLPWYLTLERFEKLPPKLCRFLLVDKGPFSNLRATGVSWRAWGTLLESLWTHGRVTKTRSRAPVLRMWHFWSTSFFSATRYRWLFSILFILFFFGVEKDDFHWH